MNPNQYIYKHPLKRSVAAAFDQVGTWIYPLIAKKSSEFNPAEIKRILAVRLDHMGDVLMVRPALKAVAEAFPQASLDFMISEEFSPLLAQDSFIHRIIPVRHHWFQRSGWAGDHYQDFSKLVQELRYESYDLGIDFRGDLRNIFLMTAAKIPARLSYSLTGGRFFLTHQGDYDRAMHQVALNLQLLNKIGISSLPGPLPLQYTEDQKRAFLERFSFLKELQTKRLIIHMGAGYPSKRWPIDSFRQLITRTLKTKTAKVILIGTKNERSDMPVAEHPGELFDLRGLLTLTELPILMDVSHFYLGNDSGPAHIAAAQAIPGLILFSGTNESAMWRPYSERLEILENKVPCAPCESQVCPLKHHDCMEQILPGDVIEKVISFLSQSRMPVS